MTGHSFAEPLRHLVDFAIVVGLTLPLRWELRRRRGAASTASVLGGILLC